MNVAYQVLPNIGKKVLAFVFSSILAVETELMQLN
jgi:hypothetical protein